MFASNDPKPLDRNLSLQEMTVDDDVMNSTIQMSKDSCLFTFDLRNVWRHPFSVSFSLDEEGKYTELLSTVVHGGSTKR